MFTNKQYTDLVGQNRQAITKKFEDYIKTHPSSQEPSILNSIDRHAGTAGVSRWGSLTYALQEILKGYKAEDLYYPEQLSQEFKKSEPDTSRKYSRDVHGLQNGETQTVFFSFAPGAETPIHNHWTICVSFAFNGEARERSFKREGSNGNVQVRLINEVARPEKSIALDLQTGDDFTHSVLNNSKSPAQTIHFYGTNINNNPNKYIYKDNVPVTGQSIGYPQIIKAVIIKDAAKSKAAEEHSRQGKQNFQERYESARGVEFSRR